MTFHEWHVKSALQHRGELNFHPGGIDDGLRHVNPEAMTTKVNLFTRVT
ncbi:hypothetical protein APY03_2576 [Variovorax sp. WDL1]|nr:hypothetical protein APY03_2576 [Variovorax sp. WDL1]